MTIMLPLGARALPALSSGSSSSNSSSSCGGGGRLRRLKSAAGRNTTITCDKREASVFGQRARRRRGSSRTFCTINDEEKTKNNLAKASEKEGDEDSSNGEVELMKRLEAAEKEAAELRQQLTDAETAAAIKPRRPIETEMRVCQFAIEEQDLPRVDSQLGYRETVFDFRNRGEGKQAVGTFSSGLTEGEMAEAGLLENDTDAEAITRTRLLQALSLVVVTGIASQIRLFDKPKKPLFLYLVSCLQLQKVLSRMKEYAEQGEWISLQQGLSDVKKPPVSARESLLGAANSLPEKAQREQAEEVALEVLDYINQADFRQYFDPQSVPAGPRATQFSEFSFKAINSAEAALTKFLNLMPREDLEGAIAQTSQSFPTAIPSAIDQ